MNARLTDWMAPFTEREDLTLASITFPASHDAGLHEREGGYEGYNRLASAKHTICQYGPVGWQLEVGSRAFDLRIARQGATLRTFHGEGLVGSLGGGWGQDAASIFREVDAFLEAHPGEIVILRISHTKEADNVHGCVLANIDPSRRYCLSRNLAKVPLRELRGKALVIFDAEALAEARPTDGLHRFSKYKGDGEADGPGLHVCGEYAGQMAGTGRDDRKMREMAQLALTCSQKHGDEHGSKGARRDHVFMVYWQLAWNVKYKTVNEDGARDAELTAIDDARGTHYNLDFLLNAHRAEEVHQVTTRGMLGGKTKVGTSFEPRTLDRYRPNWINLDFVDEAVCGKIVEFNEWALLWDAL